ncbi:MAG: hypothetical protein HY077_18095 [Elusimicrobia bacterium]|nr:hypothetical protein [Elusimicrobiota bacterium]
MPDWDEEALKEINSLDAARLAIRGALSTIRGLQEQSANLKAEVQDEASRRKLVESRMADLNAQLERWREQGKAWEESEKRRACDEERQKVALRISVRAEERAQIQENQRQLEDHLSRLQAELQLIAAGQREKEAGWEQIKKKLEAREIELVQAEREKAELSSRYRRDVDMIQSLREARDREIAASIKSRELEVADRDREIAALRRETEEQKQNLAATAKDLDLKLSEREEKYIREYRLKEQALQERYAKREMELQSVWSEVENGLWKRAKEARDNLDKAAASQFEERARALADRSHEIDESLKRRRLELDGDFQRRCAEAEARYAEAERTLSQGWIEKEQRFLKKYGEEVAAETARLQTLWHDKLKAADDARAQAALEEQKRREDFESEHRRLKENLLEEAARKDAERIRQQDDLIARKTAELEFSSQERETARRDAFAEEKRLAVDELNRRRIEVIDDNARSLESAKQSVDKQYEERVRALEASFGAKVAEGERAQKAAEEQFLDFKAGLMADHALKEKNLDSRWAAREAELVSRHQTQLEAQRRDFETALGKTQEEAAQAGGRAEAALLSRRNALEDHYDKLDRQLRQEWARREDEQRRRHELQLAALRDEHVKELQVAAENAAGELARGRAELSAQLAQARKENEASGVRRRDLEEQLAQASSRADRALDELQSKARAWQADRVSLERQYDEREAVRERKHQEMEQALRSLWTQKEAEAVESRLRSLEEQHRHYSEQTAKGEEAQRRAVEDWRLHQTLEMEKQKAAWLAAREKELGERRRALESDYEQKVQIMGAELRKREAELQKQCDEVKAEVRLEMDQILREREKAFSARYAALERELSARWAEQARAQKPSTDGPPQPAP